ncbi:MAG: PilZ domain-containing protein [Myxococcales bacterium]|nr:PilZ domain-containing protein [Myxococcales bacterium]
MYELLESLPHSRRSTRRPVDVPCDVVCTDSEEPMPLTATDLSAYGMWIPTSFPLRPGQRVVLSFRPPRWPRRRELTVFAEVARVVKSERRAPKQSGSQAGGMGLSFSDLAREDRVALQRCLRAVSAPAAGRAPRPPAT